MTDIQLAILVLSDVGCLYGAIYGSVGFAGVIHRANCPQITDNDSFCLSIMGITGFVVFLISMIGPLCLLLR